jgi:thiamine biosynthesis protein ThiS
MIQVDDQVVEWKADMTLADLLAQMPEVRFCAVVRMNGRLVSSPRFHDTRIPDHAVIQLLPLVAGG